MDEWMDDHRCFDCDSRHCWDYSCRVVGNVYVPGRGWKDPGVAALLALSGVEVRWEEVVTA